MDFCIKTISQYAECDNILYYGLDIFRDKFVDFDRLPYVLVETLYYSTYTKVLPQNHTILICFKTILRLLP